MDVTVSGRDGALRIALVGELDDGAPTIIDAAASAALDDHVPLYVDTAAAGPRDSPILALVDEAIERAATRQVVVRSDAGTGSA